MFVDREREIRELFRLLELHDAGACKGVLIYGLRRVGKTTLVEEFIRRSGIPGLIVDLSWVGSVDSLASVIKRRIEDSFGLKLEEPEIGDPIERLRRALSLPDLAAQKLDRKIIFAMDEFHVIIEKIPHALSRSGYGKKGALRSRILWALRDAIQSSKRVFWVLLTSVSFATVRERTKDEYGRDVLLSTLNKLEVRPLSVEDAKKLAMGLAPWLAESEAQLIAESTGGIPRLIEIIVANLKEGDSVAKRIAEMVAQGVFDEVFEAIVHFLFEMSSRDYPALAGVLKAVAMGKKRPSEVAEVFGTDRQGAYLLLEELHRLGLLRKEKVGRESAYELRYPMMAAWLTARVEPTAPNLDAILRTLGITAESYVRELLRYMEGKSVEIWDDERGTFLAGTAKVLKLSVSRVLDVKETHSLGADAAFMDAEGNLVLVEVKAKVRELRVSDLKGVFERARKGERWLVFLLGTGPIPPVIVAEAAKSGVVIVTREGVKMIAKKLDFPFP